MKKKEISTLKMMCDFKKNHFFSLSVLSFFSSLFFREEGEIKIEGEKEEC